MNPEKNVKIAVFLGGTSSERDVSLVTGYNIARGLDELGYEVEAFDVAFGAHPFDFRKSQKEIVVRPLPPEIEELKKLTTNIFDAINFTKTKGFHLVFNALHGGYGENGQLQTLLDLNNIRYTGSGAVASAIAMDKMLTKVIAERYGIPTAPWMLYQNNLEDIKRFFSGKTMVVKPATEGSTIGLSIIKKTELLKEAIDLASKYSKKVIIEEYIPGRELTVAILENDALPIIEIKPHSGFYDYESKYQGGKTDYIVPAELPDELAKAIQKEALKIFRILECRHYARIDFRLHENEKDFYLLEVNTLPGMTPTSLVPKAAKAVGLSFNELLHKIVVSALKGE